MDISQQFKMNTFSWIVPPLFLMVFFNSFTFADPAIASKALTTKEILESSATGAHRGNAHINRNRYRHPVRTLDFFGLKPDMSVVEIWPGAAGWYTEILAPTLKDKGHLYAAHFPKSSPIKFFSQSHHAFRKKLESSPEIYGNVKIVHFMPPEFPAAAKAESADLVLTFRNVHNWIKSDKESAFFNAFHQVLKPGGILGVVEHRGSPAMTKKQMSISGYVPESYVIQLAEKAGFKLVSKAEFNSNTKDYKRYPEGVWTLPPTLRLQDQDREKYLGIGESDRMTLKFIKKK